MKQFNDVNNLIEEYIEREIKIGSLIECIAPRIHYCNYESSPLDFYPELKLEKPYTCLNNTLSIPIPILLPYYANIVVIIHPSFNERDFIRNYGLGRDELLNLRKDGKVKLILDLPLNHKISDYLIPIYEEGLSTGIPTFERMYFFMRTFGGSDFDAGWRDASTLFKGKFENIDDDSTKDFISKEDIKSGLEYLSILEYSNLRGFGFDEIADKVKNLAQSDPLMASCISQLYSQFLVYPTINSFDGIHLLDEEDMNLIKDINGNNVPKSWARCEIFPYEVGKSLINHANLVTFAHLEESLDYYRDFEKARKALKELEMALDEKKNYAEKYGKLYDKKIALEEIWNEMSSMDSQSKNIKKYLEVTLGIVGPIAGYAISESLGLGEFQGLLAGIAGNMLSKEAIAVPLSQRLSKMGKPNHMVEVFRFLENRKKQ